MASQTRSSAPRNAAIYARISSDDGTALGVKRQEKECRALAARLGWQVAELFVDNDVSAYARTHRPSYERLLNALAEGRLQAVLAWHPDRLNRRPADLERFLDVIEGNGVAVETVSAGAVDLSTPSGRAVARTLVAWAHFESEHKSERIKSASQERATAGRPHGRHAYGWDRQPVLDDVGRRVGSRDVVNKAQASIVREAARRVLAGESIRSVARDLNDRGIASPDGKVWQAVTVRKLLLRERNAALRICRGEIVGPANWDAILDRATWERLHALLGDTRRLTVTSNALKHLLTGIAKCGRHGCEGRMRAKRISGRDMYCCEKGYCVARRQDWVDDFVTRVILDRLSRPDAVDLLREQNGPDDDELAAGADKLRAKLDEAADQYASDQIDAAQLSRITSRLRPQLVALESQLARPQLCLLIGDVAGRDADAVWQTLSLERKRAIIDTLLEVTVLPVGKRRSREFNPKSVRVDWRPDLGVSATEREVPRQRHLASVGSTARS